ncbi:MULTISPECIES: hypothetical protein [unclassified Pseudomonas]|uniref:hypothetical protein n=1 Tax=unclassified Pseudomonas TaxID=196821 RepID=UPI002AC99973|nr:MULTISPECIES: hypothetical protein [unclassified Pseudomonas]MEB0096508.1 hypothetical protein [Pseudomonas sp. DC1.2]WPX61459.1 hypothetical protein RHM68_12740 [Pseudomonas sp. DC1.2]
MPANNNGTKVYPNPKMMARLSDLEAMPLIIERMGACICNEKFVPAVEPINAYRPLA